MTTEITNIKHAMNEMIYSDVRDETILLQSSYMNFDFLILSLGTHPTAYIKIPKGHKLFGKDVFSDDVFDNISCHCGLTYCAHKLLDNEDLDNWWIGWDYNHLNDYNGSSYMFRDKETKKWSTEEMFTEVKEVIQLIQRC